MGRGSLEDVRMSARDAALVYHKLLQLHLTGHISMSFTAGINLALCAVNLAEAAGPSIQPDTLAEVFATAALTLRVKCPSTLHFLAVSAQSSLTISSLCIVVYAFLYYACAALLPEPS